MAWIKQDIAGPIPPGLSAIATGVGALASTLSPLLSAAAAAVSAAQAFFSPTTNPYSALVDSLLAEAQDFNNDLFSTGVYYLSVHGNNVATANRRDILGIPLLTPGQAITAAIHSFEDTCDEARPQFSDSAQVSAIGILVTAPSLDQFLALIEALLNVINLNDWLSFFTQIKRIGSPPACQPELPNWGSIRLNSISDLKDIQDTINSLISALQGYKNTADQALQQLADVIAGKQNQLTQLQNQIDQLVNNLRNTQGIYIMNLPPTSGGNTAVKNALQDCPLEQSTNEYTIATIIMGGGPSLDTVNSLRKMLL